MEKLAQKEAKAARIQQGEDDAEARNEEIAERLADLAGILEHTLSIDDTINFDSLRLSPTFPPFKPSSELAQAQPKPLAGATASGVAKPSVLIAWLPWVRSGYERRLSDAIARDVALEKEWAERERERSSLLAQARQRHEREREAHTQLVRERDAEVNRFRDEYLAGNSDAITSYSAMVLERSDYPDDVPVSFDVEYNDSSNELVIACELPAPSCVPAEAEHRYVKSRDAVESKPRKAGDLRSIYREVIASVCLRSVHEILEADQHKRILSVVFNGHVTGVNPATGHDGALCLVALRVKREAFLAINLARVEKAACIEQLGGRLSRAPDGLQSVEMALPYGKNGIVEIELLPAGRRRSR